MALAADLSVAKAETPTERPAVAWRSALCSIDLLFDLVVFVALAVIGNMLPQHHRPLPGQNGEPSSGDLLPMLLDAPAVSDTVPTWLMFALGVAVPLLSAGVLSVISPVRGSVRAWLHSYLYTCAFAAILVNGGKAYCGYRRPNFLAACGFNETLGECTAGDLENAFSRSFPSGHAAGSMAPMLHTSLLWLGALRVGAPARVRLCGAASVDISGLLTLGCLLPVVLACWIAASRVRDDAHHPADVLGGALIGGGSATLWYLKYFRGPFGADSHRPRVAFRDSTSRKSGPDDGEEAPSTLSPDGAFEA